MRVEIVGGKRDGEMRVVDPRMRVMLFAVQEPFTAAWVDEADAPPISPFREVGRPLLRKPGVTDRMFIIGPDVPDDSPLHR